MPWSMPSEPFRAALRKAGIEDGRHQRHSLRTLLHHLTGESPSYKSSADELAKEILLIGEAWGVTVMQEVVQLDHGR